MHIYIYIYIPIISPGRALLKLPSSRGREGKETLLEEKNPTSYAH